MLIACSQYKPSNNNTSKYQDLNDEHFQKNGYIFRGYIYSQMFQSVLLKNIIYKQTPQLHEL